MPEPSNYPPGYNVVEGIRIGDVGIIGFDGGFRFFFNVCLPVSHPINRKAPRSLVPIAFEAVGDIDRSRNIFRQNRVISSGTSRKWLLRSQIEVEGYEWCPPIILNTNF